MPTDFKKDGFVGDSFLVDHFVVLNPDTPRCVQERSRSGLSTICTLSLSFEKGEKWTRPWSSLRSEIVTILL